MPIPRSLLGPTVTSVRRRNATQSQRWSENVEERFWAKVAKGEPTECWLWQGNRTAPGMHGRISIGGRMVMAHRYRWELAWGPIPDGLHVLHACDEPACVNIAHLMLGTLAANSVDAGRKGRLGTGKNDTHCRRGHPFEGNTYIHPVTGRRGCWQCIRDRDKARPARPPRATGHWAEPDDAGACRTCGERLEYGSFGQGRSGWRHSRWAK